MKKVALLGKGSLAIKVGKWLNASNNFSLTRVVPNAHEPEWTELLSEWALKEGLHVIHGGHYKDLDPEHVDIVFSVFYDKIINKKFIDRCKCIINLHNAPLPKYRGVSPINWALKNNESYHGVTIHKISPGIDNGDILGMITYPIYPEIEEVRDVYEKSLVYGYELFKDVFTKFDHSFENAKPQEGEVIYKHSGENKFLGNRKSWSRHES